MQITERDKAFLKNVFINVIFVSIGEFISRLKNQGEDYH